MAYTYSSICFLLGFSIGSNLKAHNTESFFWLFYLLGVIFSSSYNRFVFSLEVAINIGTDYGKTSLLYLLNRKTLYCFCLQFQEDNEIIKVNVRCPVRGDIVMECITLDEDLKHEVMVFRIMFNTAYIEDNLLLLDRDQIDILWDTKHRFPIDFRVEVTRKFFAFYTFLHLCILPPHIVKHSFCLIIGYIFGDRCNHIDSHV